jgi:ABC-2 type transport system ATP-binding protein
MASSATTDEGAVRPEGAARPTRIGAASGPVVVEVRQVSKTFRVPDQRLDTLKERATHPFKRVHTRELSALRNVSFDVHQGEFFGIVGRNGSGKSTLLKILASIYRPDSGRVRMAGRMAPFIELGVGFNPEMTARQNVILNGVLFGLTRREAQRRVDDVIEFAELEDFLDLKLKNYSSGMMVRLAFAVMVQADADVMLIDEVLAVGDASFAQKCMDVFYDRRRRGKTIILVTHDMATVQSLCHRAIVLHDGELEYAGEPEDAALRYLRLNFGGPPSEQRGPPDADRPVAEAEINGRVVQARLLDDQGAPIENVEQGEPIRLDIVLQAARELDRPTFFLHVLSAEGEVVLAVERRLDERLAQGQRVQLGGEIENLLVPGRYSIDCWIRRDRETGDMVVQGLRVTHFVVYGTAPRHGLVSLPNTIEPRALPPGER